MAVVLDLAAAAAASAAGGERRRAAVDEELRRLRAELQRLRTELRGSGAAVAQKAEEQRLAAAALSSARQRLRAATEPPVEFLCPVTQEMMRDPVFSADGHSYERTTIETWFAQGRRTSPRTGSQLDSLQLVPNHALRMAIDEFVRRTTPHTPP